MARYALASATLRVSAPHDSTLLSTAGSRLTMPLSSTTSKCFSIADAWAAVTGPVTGAAVVVAGAGSRLVAGGVVDAGVAEDAGPPLGTTAVLVPAAVLVV